MKIRAQIDLLLGVIVMAVLVTTLTSVGTTYVATLSGTTLPYSLALPHVISPLEPAPETYRFAGELGRIVVGQHTMKRGETLESLARDYGSTATSLRSSNHLETYFAILGKKNIVVHNGGEGMLSKVREKKGSSESLRKFADRFNQKPEKIARANGLPGVALLADGWLAPGQVLFVPNARYRFTEFSFPVDEAKGKRLVSSDFGMRRHPIYRYKKFHKGLDLPRPYGFPVKASREGHVIFADWREGFGRLIIVKHPGGSCTWYGHLSGIAVSQGERVAKGQFIGRVGSSGISTGPHLHFEVRDAYGNSLNPKNFL